jgi:hypothetical protein
MIKNKKILLICKESFSFPLFFIAKKLLNNGNEVGAFFVQPGESYYNKSAYNQNTYYKFKEQLTDVQLFGLKDVCEKFNEINNNPVFNKDYLDYLEKEFTHFKNLNLQITTSQLMTRHLHSRMFFGNSTFNQNLNLLELSYKKVIEILDDYKPDLILDTEDGELIRSVLNEVTHKKGIPYITIDYPRFEGYKLPTYCLGVKTESFFKDEYNRCLKMTPEELATEYSYIRDFNKNSSVMSKEFKNTITSQYKPNGIIPTMKYLIVKILYFWNVYIINGNLKLRRKNNILYANPIKHFLFYAQVEFKKQLLLRPNRYFESPDENDDYVYMPLHLIPESTTFVKAPFYINELHIIEQVSKSLPIGWKLYVKEHQAMLGERSFEFYKKVKKFPNVKLVQLNYYNDPKPWIEKAKGVITITGTGAYESAMLGKRSIVFGDVPFNLIEGISRVNSFEELPKLLASLGLIDNVKSCAAYIAAVKSTGMELNLKYLISEGEAILSGHKKISDEFQKQVDQLSFFYERSYERYMK